MNITDRIYSTQTIHDPLVLELIHTQSFQRLKGVDLAGWYEPYVPNSKVSRYEHSLGVYFLLNMFNTSREEQIAGLLHDISHSAFSHCIDYILDEGSPSKHSHQDTFHNEYVRSTDIPNILTSHNMNIDHVLDDARHLLKERPIPELCADRIDYSVRGALVYKEISVKQAKSIIQGLHVLSSQWVFDSYISAKFFAQMFETMNRKHYSGFSSAVMFQTVSDVMKYSLQKKYIYRTDLYSTDDEVIQILKKYITKDLKLLQYWDRMNACITAYNNPKNFESKVIVKSRITDPFFIDKDKIVRVSDRDHGWKKVVEKELIPKTYYLRFDTFHLHTKDAN